MSNELATLDTLKQYEHELTTIATPQEAQYQRGRNADLTTHVKHFIKDRQLRDELAWTASKLYCETSAILGSMWGMDESRRIRGQNESSENFQMTTSWHDYGFTSPRDAVTCERVGELPRDVRYEYYDDCRDENKQPSLHGLEEIWKDQRGKAKPHVANNSGENEWYTPAELITAARQTMGSIDTDPASSDIANEIVQAETYYTKDDNGLAYTWTGNVWMNPPYSQPEISDFATKIIEEVDSGRTEQACVLVNNATDTAWCQRILIRASAVCFIYRRVKFLDKELNPSGAPLQGQIVIYIGKDTTPFTTHFKEFGIILYA